jgi:hypothetical protein
MRLIKLIGCVFIAVSIISSAFFFGTGYEGFLVFLKDRGIPGTIPSGTYYKLGVALASGVVIGMLIIIFPKQLLRATLKVGTWCRELWSELKRNLNNISKREWLRLSLVLGISLAVKFVFILYFPVTYDEAWSYLNFTARGFAFSISYYPAPNNHILNSVCTNILSALPLPAGAIIRLPAFFANHLFLFLFYIFLKNKTTATTALIAIAACCFLPPVFIYGILGRGYSFILLFFLICYICSINLLTGTHTSRYLFLFSVSSALGFYTMPSFLYPYLTLNLSLLIAAIKHKDLLLIKRLVLWGLATGASVLLLYTPVIVVSGIKSLVANPYVRPISRQAVMENWFPHFSATFEFLFIFKIMLLIVPALCLFAVVLLKDKRTVGTLTLWVIGCCMIIPFLHSVLPFLRTWIYVLVPVIVSLSLLIQTGAKNMRTVPLMTILLLLMAGTSYSSHKVLTFNEDQAIQTLELTEFLLDNEVQSVFIGEPLTDAFVLFAYKRKNKEIKCSIRQEDLVLPQSDIAYLILRKGDGKYAHLKPVYVNDYVSVYPNPLSRTLN